MRWMSASMACRAARSHLVLFALRNVTLTFVIGVSFAVLYTVSVSQRCKSGAAFCACLSDVHDVHGSACVSVLLPRRVPKVGEVEGAIVDCKDRVLTEEHVGRDGHEEGHLVGAEGGGVDRRQHAGDQRE